MSTKLVDTKIPQLRGIGTGLSVVRQWLNFSQVAEQHRDYPPALESFALLPVNLTTDARVDFDNRTVPVVASIVWFVASYLVSNFEGFERVRARDAREQFHQFLLMGSGEFREQIAKAQKTWRNVGSIGSTALCKGFCGSNVGSSLFYRYHARVRELQFRLPRAGVDTTLESTSLKTFSAGP